MKKPFFPKALTLAIGMALALPSYAIRYTYDDLNRLVSASYSSGKTIQYEYDAGGNLLRVQLRSDLKDVVVTLLDKNNQKIVGATLEIVINGQVVPINDAADGQEDGKYAISSLPKGDYEIKVTKGDFIYPNVTVTADSATEISTIIGDGVFPPNEELTQSNTVIVGSYACNENTISMLSNTGGLFHSFNPELDAKGVYLNAVDFNRDALTDIAVGGIGKGKDMFIYNTNRKLIGKIISNGDDKGVLIAFGDLDGNDSGDFEIFVTNQSADDTVNMYESNGKAIRALSVLGNKAKINIATGDVNGDGVDELVVAFAEQTDGDNVLIFNQNGTKLGSFTAQPNNKASTGLVLVVADVTGDMKAEIIVAEASEAESYGVAVYSDGGELLKQFTAFSGDVDMPTRRSDGSALAKCTDAAYSGQGLLLAAGDVNADGKADIIVARSGYRSVKLFDGAGQLVNWFVGADEGYQITALSYGNKVGVSLPDIDVLPADVIENATIESKPGKTRIEIDGQEIRGTVRVANVLIIKVEIKIGSTLVAGLGTRFKQRNSIPEGLDLRGTCHKKKKNKKNKKHHDKLKHGKKGKNTPQYIGNDSNNEDIDVLDLSTPVVDGQPSVLEDIQVLVGANARRMGLRRDEAMSVTQNSDNGDVEVRQGNALLKLSPVGMKQAALDASAGISIDADGMLHVTTHQGQVVSFYAAAQNIDAFLDALNFDDNLISLEVDDDGQMRASYNTLPNGYQVGRAHFFSDVLADQSVPDGLHPANLIYPGLNQGVVLVFTDTDGSKRWQWILPTPADRAALKALAEKANSLDSIALHFDGAVGTIPGTVTIVINGQEYLASFDYTVRQGTPPASGGVEFTPVDATRFEVVYPNGDRQYLNVFQ